jgi:hypothetical protein
MLQDLLQIRDRSTAIAVLPDEGRGPVELMQAVPLQVVNYELLPDVLE